MHTAYDAWNANHKRQQKSKTLSKGKKKNVKTLTEANKQLLLLVMKYLKTVTVNYVTYLI